jgi:uncharacterized protein DUF4145
MSSGVDEFSELIIQAQTYASNDPGTSLMKLRIFGELVAKKVGERRKIARSDHETADDYLNRLESRRALPHPVARLLHELRTAGNAAAHGESVSRSQAQEALHAARQVEEWMGRRLNTNSTDTDRYVPFSGGKGTAAERLRGKVRSKQSGGSPPGHYTVTPRPGVPVWGVGLSLIIVLVMVAYVLFVR